MHLINWLSVPRNMQKNIWKKSVFSFSWRFLDNLGSCLALMWTSAPTCCPARRSVVSPWAEARTPSHRQEASADRTIRILAKLNTQLNHVGGSICVSMVVKTVFQILSHLSTFLVSVHGALCLRERRQGCRHPGRRHQQQTSQSTSWQTWTRVPIKSRW